MCACFSNVQKSNANDMGLNIPSSEEDSGRNCGSLSSDWDYWSTWGHLNRERHTNLPNGNAEKIAWSSGQPSSTCKCNSNTFINSMFVSSFIRFSFLIRISITALCCSISRHGLFVGFSTIISIFRSLSFVLLSHWPNRYKCTYQTSDDAYAYSDTEHIITYQFMALSFRMACILPPFDHCMHQL